MTDSTVTDRLARSDAASPGRACFVLRVRPEKLDEYLLAHERVWEEMRQALTDAGWRHYSLFVRPGDGLVVGYFETVEGRSATEVMSAMSATDVDARWQASMAPYFTVDGGTPQMLSQYFYLP